MSNLVPIADPLSGQQIENYANQIVNGYQPAALHTPQPFDIERFYEIELEILTGVRGEYRECPPGIYGYTDINEMVSVVAVRLFDDPFQLPFQRSTTAHEACHAVLHARQFRRRKQWLKFVQNNQNLKLFRRERIEPFRDPEWQAWRMAKALLIPRPSLYTALRAGNRSVGELADLYQVNPAFVRSRLRDLRITLD